MTASEQLAERIKQHIRSGGVVRLATYGTCRFLEAKHANMVSGSKHAEGVNGVYVQRGKGKEYWFECYIIFSTPLTIRSSTPSAISHQ